MAAIGTAGETVAGFVSRKERSRSRSGTAAWGRFLLEEVSRLRRWRRKTTVVVVIAMLHYRAHGGGLDGSSLRVDDIALAVVERLLCGDGAAGSIRMLTEEEALSSPRRGPQRTSTLLEDS